MDTQLARLKNQSTFFLSGSSHKPSHRSSYYHKEIKAIKKVKCYRPTTDRPTDQRTDKAGCRDACTRLISAPQSYLKPVPKSLEARIRSG